MTDTTLTKSELGKKSEYDASYNPNKLYAIPREVKRAEIGIKEPLPFYGFDLWNHYEVSWLNDKGKPVVAIAEICYPCDSHSIIESKSMKLYFNSLNNSRFKSFEAVQEIVKNDIEARINGTVWVKILPLGNMGDETIHAGFEGLCLDGLDIECQAYEVKPALLTINNRFAEEVLYSNLLKSNCLITHQPDWASIQISYRGREINHENLLAYLISFRNHNEFHEQCIERIFMDIMQHCKPDQLSVYGRFTRRGGVDINPYRSNWEESIVIPNTRLIRQ